MIVKSKKFLSGVTEGTLLTLIKDNKSSGYIKKGTFSNEIIWNKKSFMFPSGNAAQRARFKSGLYLFGKVRKEAETFLRKNPHFRLPKQERSILYNNENPVDAGRKVCATDLNHAYWRIALNLGVISEDTYRGALSKKFKSIRLASLSTLGAGKTYQVIQDGKITKSTIKIGEDTELRRVYTLIRYTCFKHMVKVARMLGDDFLAYKTDCIYYYDTPYNRKLVSDYFSKNGLTYKQLS